MVIAYVTLRTPIHANQYEQFQNKYRKCSRGRPKAADEYSRGHSAWAANSCTHVVSVAMKLDALSFPSLLEGGCAKRMERLMRRAYLASTQGTQDTCIHDRY